MSENLTEKLEAFLKGKPDELPLSRLVRGFNVLGEQIAELNRKLEKLRALQQMLETHITSRMTAEDIQRMTVDGRTYYLRTQDIPVVDDWDRLLEWIRETGHLDLLQRRVSLTSLRELLEQGELPEEFVASEQPVVRIEQMLRLGNRKA